MPGCLHLPSLSCAAKVLLPTLAQPALWDTLKKVAWPEPISEPPPASLLDRCIGRVWTAHVPNSRIHIHLQVRSGLPHLSIFEICANNHVHWISPNPTALSLLSPQPSASSPLQPTPLPSMRRRLLPLHVPPPFIHRCLPLLLVPPPSMHCLLLLASPPPSFILSRLPMPLRHCSTAPPAARVAMSRATDGHTKQRCSVHVMQRAREATLNWLNILISLFTHVIVPI